MSVEADAAKHFGGFSFVLESASYPLTLVPSLLAVSMVVDGSEKLEALELAADVLDARLWELRGRAYRGALDSIGYPMVDAFELVEALGVEGLENVLSYAESIIEGRKGQSEGIPWEVKVFADLLGWEKDPGELDPETLAYTIIISFTASFNKALNKTANAP
ncbi:MAG: hypothetical protein P3X22_007050 [Thermoprotei archaeon]|nr:hypothetical protein [Thermoprotei archaeon]